MVLEHLKNIFRESPGSEAFVWNDASYSYGWLLERMDACGDAFREQDIPEGSVIAFEAEFSPGAVAAFLAMLDRKYIVAPLSDDAAGMIEKYGAIIGAAFFAFMKDELPLFNPLNIPPLDHELYTKIRSADHAGIIIFSSGSSGSPKAALHDTENLLKKFTRRRHSLRTLAFLRFDHIGGLDTLLYSLFNAGCLVLPGGKSPQEVCAAIEKHRVEVLPVSPSFLSLMLLSGAHEEHDLSSLKYITYGAEVMPEALLKKCAKVFPNVILQQKYGTTETGTLRSKSLSGDSTWVRIGGEGYQTRIVNGMLEIKAEAAMLGYLNAPSPFTEDGWFRTNDIVEEEREFLKIKGRSSDIINVGGNKVYPQEVENILLEMDEIIDATVSGEDHPLMGKSITARVTVRNISGEKKSLREKIRKYCSDKLEPYKVPSKIIVEESLELSPRMKKVGRIRHT